MKVITPSDVVPVLLFVQPRVLLILTADKVIGTLTWTLSAMTSRAVSAELPLGSHPQCVTLWWGLWVSFLAAGLCVCPC